MSQEEVKETRKRKRAQTKYLSLRLTPLQKETLQKQSVRLGYKNLTDMIRAVAGQMETNPPVPHPLWPPIPPEIGRVTVQLQQLGHLTNQMARALNSRLYRSEPLFEGDLQRIDANLATIVGFLNAIARSCERAYETKEP